MSEPDRGLLQLLRRELDFLEEGGYRSPPGLGLPLIFEDSPTCLRGPNSNCSSAECPLLNLVPVQHRASPGACRHIRLNDSGETVDLLYRQGTPQQLECMVREWLKGTIRRLEDDLQQEVGDARR